MRRAGGCARFRVSDFSRRRPCRLRWGIDRPLATADNTRLGRISKRGDRYLRTLLVHGARAVLRWVERKPEKEPKSVARLCEMGRKNVAAVAVANRNARVARATVRRSEAYQDGHVSRMPAQG